MKECTHYWVGMAHAFQCTSQRSKCSHRSLLPSNDGNGRAVSDPSPSDVTLISGRNWVCRLAVVSSQAWSIILCTAHHLVRVSASTRSNTSTRHSGATWVSICVTNFATLIVPSNHGGSLTSTLIHLQDHRTTHCHVDCSYSPFCHLVNAASESVPNEQTLCQLSSPSVVGFR